jgi:hypothetical protein
VAKFAEFSSNMSNREEAQDWMAEISQCKLTAPFPSWKGTSPLPCGENWAMFWIRWRQIRKQRSWEAQIPLILRAFGIISLQHA